jgi:hypothetical protein
VNFSHIPKFGILGRDSSSKLAWNSAVHSKALFFSSSFIIGLATLEKSFMNQWWYPANPRKL